MLYNETCNKESAVIWHLVNISQVCLFQSWDNQILSVDAFKHQHMEWQKSLVELRLS